VFSYIVFPVSTNPEFAKFLEQQQVVFEQLLLERRRILDSFAQELHALEDKRDRELLNNFISMKKLGIEEERLPMPPETHEEGQKKAHTHLRKLTHTEIKRYLRYFMERGQKYPTSVLLSYLRITQKDFKEFARKEKGKGGFLRELGQLRWTEYELGDETA
jgi:hypothetical protein